MQTNQVIGFADNPQQCAPCADYEELWPELTITGPELVEVGAVFTAAGGRLTTQPTYTWHSASVRLAVSGANNNTATVTAFNQVSIFERREQKCKGSILVNDDCATAAITILLKKQWVTQNGWKVTEGMDLRSEVVSVFSPYHHSTLTPEGIALLEDGATGTHGSCQIIDGGGNTVEVAADSGAFYNVIDSIFGALPFVKSYVAWCPSDAVQDYQFRRYYFYHCVESWSYDFIPFERLTQTVQDATNPFSHAVHVSPRQAHYWANGAPTTDTSKNQEASTWYRWWDFYHGVPAPDGRGDYSNSLWYWFLPPEDELPGGAYYQEPPEPPLPALSI